MYFIELQTPVNPSLLEKDPFNGLKAKSSPLLSPLKRTLAISQGLKSLAVECVVARCDKKKSAFILLLPQEPLLIPIHLLTCFRK
jgi:hypothetical protein